MHTRDCHIHAQHDAVCSPRVSRSEEDDHDLSGPLAKKQKAKPAKKVAWCLVVQMTFSSEAKRTEFLALFEPYAQFIKENEPTTLAYEVLVSDKDPKVVTMFERFKDREYAYNVAHKTTPEFRKFRAALTELAPELDGHSYYEHAGSGFISR